MAALLHDMYFFRCSDCVGVSDVIEMLHQKFTNCGDSAATIRFATSRAKLLTTRHTDEAELLGIGKAIGELGKGTYGLVSDFDNWQSEMAWMKKLSIDNRCQVNSVLFFRQEEDWPRVQLQLEFVRNANDEGAQLIPHVGARPLRVYQRLRSQLCAW